MLKNMSETDQQKRGGANNPNHRAQCRQVDRRSHDLREEDFHSADSDPRPFPVGTGSIALGKCKPPVKQTVFLQSSKLAASASNPPLPARQV
jgi:hypothetical protein